MPDLPELYEALDKDLTNLLHLHNLLSLKAQYAEIVSALCAAIEVKQTQELHEMLNDDSEVDVLWDRIDKLTWKIPDVEEKETTTHRSIEDIEEP